MKTNEIRFGGSFATRITPEKIKRYRELVDSAERKIKETLLPLIDMVEAFCETPDSTLDGPELKVHLASGVRTLTASPLSNEEIERMWDLVPYPEECAAIGKIIEGLQVDAANENSRRIEAWQRSMYDIVVSEYFGSTEEARNVIEYLRLPESITKYFTESQVNHFHEMSEKLLACNAEIAEARAKKSHANCPYPKLESTELRDAAYHLYWYANELSVDREPITVDKLG